MSENRYRTGVRLAQLEFEVPGLRRGLRRAWWINVALALALAAAVATGTW